MIKRISNTERTELKDKTGRPMRTTAKAEKIANDNVIAAAQAHVEFYDKVLKFIGAQPAPINAAAEMNRGELKAMEQYGVTCGCGELHESEKAFTPKQIEQIDLEFARWVSTEMGVQIDMAAAEWLHSYWGTDAGVTTLTPAKAGYYYQSVETYKWAYKNLEKTWKREARRSSIWARDNAFEVNLIRIVDPNDPFITELYEKGFERVTSKITKEFAPQLKKYITAETKAGTPWNQIASTINKQIKSGGLWHWQRLVRTEHSIAIHGATIKQYQEAGVGYVKWSASPTRCPICAEIAESTGGYSMTGYLGYYRLDDAPSVSGDTHPNCRCLVMSQWRLPGEVEDYFEKNKI